MKLGRLNPRFNFNVLNDDITPVSSSKYHDRATRQNIPQIMRQNLGAISSGVLIF